MAGHGSAPPPDRANDPARQVGRSVTQTSRWGADKWTINSQGQPVASVYRRKTAESMMAERNKRADSMARHPSNY